MTGLVIDETSFEVLAGDERVGSRRRIEPADAGFLNGLAARYLSATEVRAAPSVFTDIGREMYRWLDGDQGQLTRLLDRASRPLVFEVRGPRAPSEAGWALLRAPLELLAVPGGELLAEDALVRFSVVRRLGVPIAGGALDSFRLGLAFMASSPRGQLELDFEAEEAAILRAVGEARIDLLVEDTGDPVQLAHRLAELGGMPVLHLSCHGLNNWAAGPGSPGVPVLAMEDDLGGTRLVPAGELAGMLPAGLRLVFVSACLTATGADAGSLLPPGDRHKGTPGSGYADRAAHSLATALVSAVSVVWLPGVTVRFALRMRRRTRSDRSNTASKATATSRTNHWIRSASATRK